MPRMGALADMTEYVDPATAVDWSRYNRPFGSVLGTAPEDTPVVFQTRNGVKITEGDIQRGMDIGLGAATVGAPAKGIKAYHSSPHDFDKFDLAKIGTGEGAQVYGHGLYFAENPAVSGQGGQYWNQFASRFDKGDPVSVHAMNVIGANRGDRAKAIADMERILRDQPKGYDPERITAVRDFLASGKSYGRRTYEVNIKADPREMLDWDKKLSQMSPEVQERVWGAVPNDSFGKMFKSGKNDPTGRRVNEFMADAYGSGTQNKNDFVRGSAALREAGIPGIKYLDEGSRNAPISSMGIKQLEGRLEQYKADLAAGFGDPERMKYNIASIERELASYKPTSNYVVFDPGIIDIMKKYGLAGAAPVGMGALAAQDRYQSEERM